jgi:dTDP-4-dehydrorhamnose reductase
LDFMSDRLRYLPPLKAAVDQMANVTPVWYLADAIIAVAEESHGGIWHIAGREVISRYDLAGRLARLYDLPPSLVERVHARDFERDAARPLRGGLMTGKAQAALPVPIPTLEQSLHEWRDRYEAGDAKR